jgi:hypothetical protein
MRRITLAFEGVSQVNRVMIGHKVVNKSKQILVAQISDLRHLEVTHTGRRSLPALDWATGEKEDQNFAPALTNSALDPLMKFDTMLPKLASSPQID